jgi:FAD/FMN-containing dehydrogenase
MSRTFVRALEQLLPGHVVTDPERLWDLGQDWTRFVAPAPLAACRPGSADELTEVVKLAGEHHIALVPSGGRTGLAGGAVASEGELVVSLSRLATIDEVDTVGRTVRVGAGVVLEQLNTHLAAHDLMWPVDLGARGSCTVGGNISTCAGGIRLVRYGSLRFWVLGLEVVLADGRQLTLGGRLEKDNTGYDLRQLFIGAEGTLGFITAATLKLTSRPGPTDVWLFATHGIDQVTALLARVRAAGVAPEAFELITGPCLDRVEAHDLGTSPFSERHAAYALVEAERAPHGEALELLAGELLDEALIDDAVRGQSHKEQRALWALREHITESLARQGAVWKDDVSVAVKDVPAFAAALDQEVAALDGVEVLLFGHIGDGNIHVNFPRPPAWDDSRFEDAKHRVHEATLRVLDRFGGSVSAEHGIGLLKREALVAATDPLELDLMRKVKAALDPAGRLNPGKILLR